MTSVTDELPFDVDEPNPRAVIGDNQPPNPIEGLRLSLAVQYGPLTGTIEQALTSILELPKPVNDTTAAQITDALKAMRELFKQAEASRVVEKDPYLRGGEVVDQFFNALKTRLTNGAKLPQAALEQYLNAKKEAERKAREEMARRERERAEAERRKVAEELAKADAARRAQSAMKHVEKAATHQAAATVAQHLADQAEAAAQAKPSDLARTKTASGNVATLKTEWTHEITDLSKIPLETLRPYIAKDVLDRAIRQFIKAGGRELEGVRIYETSKAAIR
jgi:hypothetical protein